MFITDLKLGQKYEKKLLEMLPYDSFTHQCGYCKEYDFTITKDGIVTKYEVKSDRRAINTNNIAIEYMCNDKPSGITSTQADIYAYFIIKSSELFDLYLIPTKDLRQMLNDKKYNRQVNGGDGWRSKMYLISLNQIQQYLYKQ